MHTDLGFLKEKTLLFAEDDAIMRAQMSEVLRMLFGRVYVASDGEEALHVFEEEHVDIVITDIKMPKRDGLKLIAAIRKEDYKIPVLLMSSYAEQELLINAANLSIDGYLIKPVDLDALIGAITKAMKRVERSVGLVKLTKELYYNASTKELYQNGTLIPLGIKELELLVLFINNRRRTLTKEEIARVLWPLDEVCDSAIKNLILRMRKKMGVDIIISVRGIGYRLDTRDTSRASS
ncbi:MAG: hypothetical protein KU37_11540 [Sulfuricurvum sp. PC08-66]|nr:MAG: hypothetical protein KU37_11540 [Sulfuricurvum sp. PC08-66]